MKKLVFLLSVLFIFSCNNRNKDNLEISIENTSITKDKDRKHYGVRSGIIYYKTTLSGKIMDNMISGSGTEKLYFKDWGAIQIKERIENKTLKTNFSHKEKVKILRNHIIKKIENGIISQVDFNQKIITQQKETVENLKKHHAPTFGGKMIGHEILIGYNCDIWQLCGTKQWMYKGVPFKIENNIMGIKKVKEATRADFNTIIASHYFDLPNYPIKKQ